VMAVFTLGASYFFHPFWAVPADQAMVVSLLFYKNIGVIGGLLILAAFGPGAWSIDGRGASQSGRSPSHSGGAYA